VDGYVKVIDAVICFCFCCELQAGVRRVEILEDCLYVGVVGSYGIRMSSTYLQ